MAENSNLTNSELQQESNQPAVEITGPLDITEILKILPHRYPFLLIDRVLEIVPKKRLVAIKNVTINESFFNGHFPGYPIMPGVLTVEAMAQAGGVLLLTAVPDPESKLVVFTGIDKAKFRRPVVPGDQLRIVVDVLVWRATVGRMQGEIYVDDKLVAEAIVSCALVPRTPKAKISQSSSTPKENV